MAAHELVISVDFFSLVPENWLQDDTFNLRSLNPADLQLNPLPAECRIEGKVISEEVKAFLTRRYGHDIELNLSYVPDLLPNKASIHCMSQVQEKGKPVNKAFASLDIDLTDPAKPQYSMSESPIARGRWMQQKSALLAQASKTV